MFIHLRQPVRRISKGNWIYVGGPDSRKTVDAPLVAWENRKAPLRMVVTSIRTAPLIPINIPKKDIEEGIILKEAVTPIDKEDPEPPQNPPIPPKPVAGPSNPRKLDPTPISNPPTIVNLDNEEMADKGNKPKDYDGTKTKYREWIYGCHMYITANPTKYDTD